MILFRLRDAVDKVLREEHCSFNRGRGCVDENFTLRLIISKCNMSSYGTCDEAGRAKRSYGVSSSKILRINRLI